MNRFYASFAATAALCVLVLSSFVTAPVEKPKVLSRFFFGDIVNLDTVRISLDDCSANAKFCLPLSLGQSQQLKITDNGAPVAVTIDNGCDFDTTSAYTYSTLFGQGSFGPYHLTSWQVGSQIFTDTFNTMPELVDSMNAWDPNGNWALDPAHLLITGGNPGVNYDTMKVWVIQIQTPSFIGYNFGATPRGTELTFSKGFHEVILEDTINQMADTFFVFVSCRETVYQTVHVDSTEAYCLNFSNLATGPASVALCSTGGGLVDFSLENADSCVAFKGLAPGFDETCVVVCDSFGFCDTLDLVVRVTGRGALYRDFIEIPQGGLGLYCPSNPNLSGDVSNFTICQNDPDGYVEFLLDPASNCINYIGRTIGGTDTICVVACDDAGICDTTMLAVQVRRFGPQWIYDTLYLNELGRYCPERYLLPGQPNALEAIQTPNPLKIFYSFDQTNFCATYVGLRAGTDTLGLRLRDSGGKADTTYMVLTILKPSAQIVYDTLSAGEIAVFCLDTAELGGTNFVLDNICKNSSNDDVSFDINDITLCLEMQALSPGTDTACITLCDNLGVCDTVIFIITALDDVVNPPQPPVANPDNGLSESSQPVQIPVLTNDTISPPHTDLLVLPADGVFGPLHGSAVADPATGIVTYTPDAGFCNSTDNFRYLVCNADGCDTALVTVLVTCDTSVVEPDKTLVVHTGFSPNGDAYNEFFNIKNIEQYPNSVVTVYNRWGNQVFTKKTYKNDWSGDWEGKPLPDGAYFYYLEDGEGKTENGIVFIRR